MDSDTESLVSSEDDFGISDTESESENDDDLDSVRKCIPIDTSANVPAPPRFPFTGHTGLTVNIESVVL